MTPKRARKSRKTRDGSPPDTSVQVQIQAGTPELTRVVFAREHDVAPAEEEEYQVKFSLNVARAHARHVQMELSAMIAGIPWARGQKMVVSYQMGYFIRGRLPDAANEGLITDLARRIGPAALYPFIRETVLTTTAKAGSSIMLPLVEWGTAFPADIEIPSPQGETPPEFLEPV